MPLACSLSAVYCLSLVCLLRPHVQSPCRAEQAALWLNGDEEEQEKDFISVSPQQVL